MYSVMGAAIVVLVLMGAGCGGPSPGARNSVRINNQPMSDSGRATSWSARDETLENDLLIQAIRETVLGERDDISTADSLPYTELAELARLARESEPDTSMNDAQRQLLQDRQADYERYVAEHPSEEPAALQDAKMAIIGGVR